MKKEGDAGSHFPESVEVIRVHLPEPVDVEIYRGKPFSEFISSYRKIGSPIFINRQNKAIFLRQNHFSFVFFWQTVSVLKENFSPGYNKTLFGPYSDLDSDQATTNPKAFHITCVPWWFGVPPSTQEMKQWYLRIKELAGFWKKISFCTDESRGAYSPRSSVRIGRHAKSSMGSFLNSGRECHSKTSGSAQLHIH